MYSTSQIAAIAGVHPNTILFYEEMGLLPKAARKANGYRVFGANHVKQLKLIRIGFQSEILASTLRVQVIDILKTAAAGNRLQAIAKTEAYQRAIEQEKHRAGQAVVLAGSLRAEQTPPANPTFITHGAAAKKLGISVGVLRNWQRNGLVQISKQPNGRLLYGPRQIERLEIIRVLRNANYSLMAILRMLTQMESGETNLERAIDTPGEDEDIIHATDRYITALTSAGEDAEQMHALLRGLK